ncbi:MAG: diguanylate cyclase [Fibrobacterales bacterium]
MKGKRRFGIRFQFLTLIILLITSLFVISALINANHQKELLVKERILRGNSILRSWGSICKERLVNEDPTMDLSMYDMIDEISNEEGIQEVLLQDINGRVIIHKDAQLQKRVLSDRASQHIIKKRRSGVLREHQKDGMTYFNLYRPIFFNKKYLGVARIGMNDEGINEAIKRGQQDVLIITGIILLVGILFTYGLIYKVLSPIKPLVEGIRILGTGNLSHKIDIIPRNELGDLAEAFNSMTGNLKDAQEEIIQKAITEQKLRDKAASLKKMASTDGLTGLYNKRQYLEDIDVILQNTRRDKSPLTMLMLDMDRFKALNDTVGHAAGDQALQHLTQSILPNIREDRDRAYRVGGDEFVILLNGLNYERAIEKCNLIEETYARLKKSENLTGISFGVIEYNGSDNSEEYFNKADEEMYRVKQAKGTER